MSTHAESSSDCFCRNTEFLYNPSISFTLNFTLSGLKTHSDFRLRPPHPFFSVVSDSSCSRRALPGGGSSYLAAAELAFEVMVAYPDLSYHLVLSSGRGRVQIIIIFKRSLVLRLRIHDDIYGEMRKKNSCISASAKQSQE